MRKIDLLARCGGLVLASLALLGLAAPAQAGQWRPEAVIGGKLKTHVYVPSTAPVLNGKRALMVSLHGCGQTHDQFKQGANWPSTADQYGMVVALPLASKEGLYGSWMGCWNFHVGMSASRTKTDAKYLIAMVNALLADSSLNIDPNQVYITGLSSGAGMTNQMACLAPDIFAGAGVNAGPAPGSTGNDLSSPGISAAQGESNCETLAGSYKPHLYTQLYNNVHGTADNAVAPAHAERNTQIFVGVYNDQASISQCGTSTLSGGGDVTTYCDAQGPRISKVMVNGMSHAWPAGPGSSGGGSYIDHTHINYPAYITKFFFDNNRRVGQGCTSGCSDSSAPSVNVTAPANGASVSGTVTITANASDDSGVSYVEFYVNGSLLGSDSAAPYAMSWNSVNTPDGATAVMAKAYDAAGNVGTDNDTSVTVANGGGGFACTETYASNYSHVSAGRAYSRWGYVYATGSGDYLGLYNTYTYTRLAETAQGYFEKGYCP